MKKGQDSSKSKKTDFARLALKRFYEEAKERGEILFPDDALIKLHDLIRRGIEVEEIDIKADSLKNPKLNVRALYIELHHDAVDLFYDTYWGKRIGAPHINDEHLIYLLELDSLGLNHLEIAKIIELPVITKEERKSSKEIVRKRIRIAKERKGKLKKQ